MPGVKGMYTGGRNKKTTSQHELEGTFNATRHGGAGKNPNPPAGRPKPPRKLGKSARREWNRMVALLEELRTLSIVDGAALYQYAQLFSETEELVERKRHCAELIETLREFLSDQHNAVATNVDLSGQTSKKVDAVKAIQEITKLSQLVSRYGTQIRLGRMALRSYLLDFGLTPASRSRVAMTAPLAPAKPESPFGKLQAQARLLSLPPPA